MQCTSTGSVDVALKGFSVVHVFLGFPGVLVISSPPNLEVCGVFDGATRREGGNAAHVVLHVIINIHRRWRRFQVHGPGVGSGKNRYREVQEER